jgi:hypothetical protein
MRRLLRCSFNSLSVLSLSLLMAVAVLWARSWRTEDALDCGAGWNSSAKLRGSAIGLGSRNGHLELRLRYARIGPPRGRPGLDTWEPIRWSQSPVQRLPWSGRMFYASTEMWFYGPVDKNDPDGVIRHLGFPDWLPALLLIPLPFLWLRDFRWRREHRRRIRLGLCLKCGYDMRVTPERCSECGTVPAKLGAR